MKKSLISTDCDKNVRVHCPQRARDREASLKERSGKVWA